MNSRRAFRIGVLRYYPMPARRLKDPVRVAAIRAFNDALRTGAITRQPCEVCGRKQAEGHHDDYSRPLDIRWLCRPHHRQRDAELNRLRKATERPRPVPKPPTAPTEWLSWARTALMKSGARRRLQREPARALITAVTLAVVDETLRQGLSQSEIARRTDSSRQNIGLTFGGGIKTFKTLAVVADALGCEVHVEIRPKAEKRASA